MDEVITLQFDGGSRGNPGPAGIGVVLRAADGTPLVTLGRFIGRATNNVAEYRALITSLEEARKLGATKVVVRGDSELVVRQMRGEYRVKNPNLKVLHDEAKALLSRFEQSKVEHNYRESNALADKLANLAMDRRRDVTDVDGDDGGGVPSVAPRAPTATRATTAPRAGAASPPLSDGPQGRASVGREAPARVSAAHESPTATAVPAIGTSFACPRCRCAVTVTRPSTRDGNEFGPFLCGCGVRMKPDVGGDE